MSMTQQSTTPQEQAGRLLGHIAGHVAVRTVEIGLRHGLLARIGEHPDGISPDKLAAELGLDPFYTGVWCRSAHAAGVLERSGDGSVMLGAHMQMLLLDGDAPAHVGATFTVITQPEIFDEFSRRLPSGERLWWNETSDDFIRAVSGTGRPFYTRLIPGGLERVPGLADMLTQGGNVLDTACGAGRGVIRLAQTYPELEVTGADGDAHSLDVARGRIREAGLEDRIRLVHTPLEELDFDGEFDLVTNNISMHECRDIDKVTRNIHRALAPGGWFVISDFPFPPDSEGLQTVPGRIMAGIQFFEALIDDQLLPVEAYLDLLGRHGFRDVDTTTLTPVHALTYGRK